MEKLKNLNNSILLMLLIAFIEQDAFDHITFYFAVWTVVDTYHSLRFRNAGIPALNKGGIPASMAAASVLAAYIAAAVDVRFIHISDNIPTGARYIAAALYSIIVFFKVFLISFLLDNSPHVFQRLRVFCKSAPTFTRLLNVAMIPAGQVALNSRLSILVSLPAALIYLQTLFEWRKA